MKESIWKYHECIPFFPCPFLSDLDTYFILEWTLLFVTGPRIVLTKQGTMCKILRVMNDKTIFKFLLFYLANEEIQRGEIQKIFQFKKTYLNSSFWYNNSASSHKIALFCGFWFMNSDFTNYLQFFRILLYYIYGAVQATQNVTRFHLMDRCIFDFCYVRWTIFFLLIMIVSWPTYRWQMS